MVDNQDTSGYYPFMHHNPTNDGYEDAEYFGSYGKVKIHEEMLKDKRRTETYRRAIEQNAHLFKGKVVMDVGCGTGVLSFFAAKVGAARVYAIEASEMAHNTELIVEKNGLSHIIKVLHGKLEELFEREAIPERVDVIISEWMGSFLLFESMIESVIFARDTYLMPGGLIWPSSANIFISAVNMESLYKDRINFWKNVYDIDMSPLIPFAQEELFSKPIKDQMADPTDLISNHVCLKHFDLYTLTMQQLSKFLVPVEFTITANSIFHGFVTWFDVRFENRFSPTDTTNETEQITETTTTTENTEYTETHTTTETSETYTTSTAIDSEGETLSEKTELNGDGKYVNLEGKGMGEDKKEEIEQQSIEQQSTEYSTIILSTSPFESATHWKNDIYLFENPVTVSKDQVINGVIRVLQHQRYRRHWWLELSFSIDKSKMSEQAQALKEE
eukprot:TRINITY_DN2582_c0_g1_i15.p1 TRINITY_DN2582_c0_g1~~TRINITY_DN2582_c0_g1_i15.p1  ORF type:complete len:445 (-),score=87.78 TRINITY_DN2582_c0_g1_i15:447-1781(-)